MLIFVYIIYLFANKIFAISGRDLIWKFICYSVFEFVLNKLDLISHGKDFEHKKIIWIDISNYFIDYQISLI